MTRQARLWGASVRVLALVALGGAALAACDLVVTDDPAVTPSEPVATTPAPTPDPAPVPAPDPTPAPEPTVPPPPPPAPVLPDPEPDPVVPPPVVETPEPSPVAPGDAVDSGDGANLGVGSPDPAPSADGPADGSTDVPTDGAGGDVTEPGDGADAPSTNGGEATDGPATDGAATDGSATDAPATDAPGTDSPTTDGPATDEPATDGPAVDAPAGDVPAGDGADAGGDPGADAPQPPVETPTFTYLAPGDLKPGTGQGAPDRTNYADMIVFPIPGHATFLNSQVHSPGGGPVGGDQCDTTNFSYPWRNNFCETRSSDRKTLNCPKSRVHQGQDIRAGTPALCNQMRRTPAAERTQVPVVAVEDGIISYIGTYTVDLRAQDRIYRYMHLNMAALQVARGDTVTAGQQLGFLSNDFGGTPTTMHLHLEFKQNIDGVGWTWVNPYTSLVRAYEKQLGGVGLEVSADTASTAAARP